MRNKGHEQDWWKRCIVYQIFPLSFQDSNGDGKGDLPGLLSRLDYLQWLGVDAVWLGPVYVSPMVDWGFDAADFTAIDALFGSLDDFDRLIHALHQRGIRLILDFMPNHTSERHPWFQESRSSRNSPKRDWYVWADPAPGGEPPNNWLSRFGGSAWEWDAATRQYYYHAFLEEQPDLNWRSREVRAAIAECLRFWLRRGVDGFRLDASAALAEDARLRDDPPKRGAEERTPPERLRRIFTNYRPESLEWLEELRGVVDELPGRVLLGEVETALERIGSFYGSADRPRLHLPLNYRLMEVPWQAQALAAAINDYVGSLPGHAWPVWAMGGQDKERVASRVGAEQARAAAMLGLTLRGTPVVYSGDELGMQQVPVAGEDARDPFERRVPGYGLSRDPERSPMQWDTSANAGFTTGEPWLPVAQDYAKRNVEVERADPRSILNLYRGLIALRRSERAVTDGTLGLVSARDGVLSYERKHGERRLRVVLNLGASRRVVPSDCTGRIVLSTYLDHGDETVAPGCELRGFEGLVIALDR